jgi:hypothetical protein
VDLDEILYGGDGIEGGIYHSNTYFVGLRRHAALNLPLFPHTCSGVDPAFLEISVAYTANGLDSLREEGGYLF